LFKVDPLLHVLFDEDELVKLTLPSIQKVVGPSADIVGIAGKEFTVTDVAADVALPQLLLTVTV
jgi:hypothetical protein